MLWKARMLPSWSRTMMIDVFATASSFVK